jgi:hypothetical protein
MIIGPPTSPDYSAGEFRTQFPLAKTFGKNALRGGGTRNRRTTKAQVLGFDSAGSQLD